MEFDDITSVINKSLNDALNFIMDNNIPYVKFNKLIKSIYRFYLIDNICRYIMQHNVFILSYNDTNIIYKLFNRLILSKILIDTIDKLNKYLPICITDKNLNDNGILLGLKNLLISKKSKISNFNKLRRYAMINGLSSLNTDLFISLQFRQFFMKK